MYRFQPSIFQGVCGFTENSLPEFHWNFCRFFPKTTGSVITLHHMVLRVLASTPIRIDRRKFTPGSLQVVVIAVSGLLPSKVPIFFFLQKNRNQNLNMAKSLHVLLEVRKSKVRRNKWGEITPTNPSFINIGEITALIRSPLILTSM